MFKKNVNKKREGVNYWLSYSDMMAALILLLVLVLSIALYYVNDQYKKTIEAQSALVELVGVRTELYEELKTEFNIEGDDYLDADGNFKLAADLLFDSDSSKLKPAGKEFLKDFMPRYLSILMDEKFQKEISEVLIVGFTDDDMGKMSELQAYSHNVDLAQARARSVVMYCVTPENKVLSPAQITFLKDVVSSAGNAFRDYIENEDGTRNPDASRRVEIKFRLKTENNTEFFNTVQGIIGGTAKD